MEEVAPLEEAPLIPGRGFTTSPAVDADLRQRIRSLLIARNQRNPPRTPPATPDYTYVSVDKTEAYLNGSPLHKGFSKSNPSHIIARLSPLETKSVDMGAVRFDGPAGQIADDDPHTQRRPSQVIQQSDRGSSFDDTASAPMLGLDRRAQGDILGRETRIPDVMSQQKSTSSASTRRPRFHLRTVPPTVDVNKTLRPIAQHVPGSYQSEVLSPREKAIDSLHEIVSHEGHTSVTPTPGSGLSQLNAKYQPSTKLEGPHLAKGQPELHEQPQNTSSHHNDYPLSPNESAEDALFVVGDKEDETRTRLADTPLQTSSLAPTLPEDSEDANDQSKLLHTEIDTDLKTPKEESAHEIDSPVRRAMSIISGLSGRSSIRTPSVQSLRWRSKNKHANGSNLTRRPTHHATHAAQEAEHRLSSPRSDSTSYGPLVNKHHPQALAGSESTSGAIVMRQDHRQDQSFTKVIEDLESLLKDALHIAGHVAGKEDHQYARSSRCSISSDSSSSASEGADEENNHTTVRYGNVTGGEGHVSIEEPGNDELYHGHFTKARNATPYPARTRHASTVPTDVNLPESEPQATQRENLELRRITPNGPQDNRVNSLRDSQPSGKPPYNMQDRSSRFHLELKSPPIPLKQPRSAKVPAKEQRTFHIREHGASEGGMTRESILDYVHANQRPPVEIRSSSVRKVIDGSKPKQRKKYDGHLSEESGSDCVPYVVDFTTSGLHYHPVYQAASDGNPSQVPQSGPNAIPRRQDTLEEHQASKTEDPEKIQGYSRHLGRSANRDYNLNGRSHVSIEEPRGFSLSRSHRRSPIARDWSITRKRFVATITCITTAFMSFLIGIYAGEVPAIQYALADEHHYVILGNVLLFIGLAITTALFYPLPLLHGRKTYTLAALAILLPLQFPQALAINAQRSPYIATYRVGLLVPRIFAGLVVGFANINFLTTLLDLFGASLQSGNPHQEIVNHNDVRRHGGGMGVWLGIWTWSSIGSIGIGFLIGAGIISKLDVSWGYWITIILNAAVLLLNILSPEVRRAAYRRSMTEVRSGTDVSRRVARGEIKMHLASTGPIWWWEEVWWGHVLAIRMLKQPGFAILSLYLGWIYGQVVLVIVVSLEH